MKSSISRPSTSILDNGRTKTAVLSWKRMSREKLKWKKGNKLWHLFPKKGVSLNSCPDCHFVQWVWGTPGYQPRMWLTNEGLPAEALNPQARHKVHPKHVYRWSQRNRRRRSVLTDLVVLFQFCQRVCERTGGGRWRPCHQMLFPTTGR